jgi:outer membrane receptor protein involved in Fe transport
MMERLTRPLFAVIVAMLLLPAAAFAQEQASGTYLEEVIVTATKREESVQDIPIAVTAVSQQQLERAGVKDIRDLGMVAPSFNMNSSQTESQGSTLRIRGVGTTGNNIGLESAVGVFLDGVYLARPGVALGDLLDVEAVEVLRGPQGTLFGRNTSAGALNIRTLKPNMDETEFFGNFTGGNFNSANVQMGVSGPVADNIGFRLSGAYRKQDGFLESTTGAESRNRDRWMLRGQLLFEFNDRADLRIIADYAEADENCCDAVIVQETPAVALGSFAAAGLPADGGAPASGDDAFKDRISNAELFENPFEQGGFSAEFNYDINETTTLTYIGAYRDFKARTVQYSDFVSMDVFSVRPEVADGWESFDDIESMTHELRVAGASDRFSWMVGFYYSDEKIVEQGGLGLGEDYTQNMDAVLWNFVFAPNLEAAEGLRDVPLATGGTFGDVLDADNQALAFSGGVNSAGAYAQNLYTQKGESWSVFTHNTWSVTDQLDLIVGLRYVDEKKDGSFEQFDANNAACFNNLNNAGALAAGAPEGLETLAGTIGAFSAGYACFPFATPAAGVSITPAEFDDSFKDDELVYTIKGNWAFTDNISTYLSYTHGFKSGGFNLASTAAVGGADPSFRSELVDAWELGFKSELFDRRIRLNGAIFSYDLEDFQVLEFTGIQFVTFNVPNAKSEGFEIEAFGLATENLELSLGYMYADSRYPSDCDNGEGPAQVASLCGAQFTNAPKHVVTAGAGWDGYIGQDLIYFLSGNLRWEDDRRTSTQPGLPLDWQEANTKVHLRAGLGSSNGNWMLELWSDNAFDKQTKNVTFNVPLRAGSTARGSFLEAPRTYGATLRVRL